MTTPGAERRAGGAGALERQRHVELVGPDEAAGRAAEQDGLQRRPAGTPPASSIRSRSVAPNSTS